MAKTNGIETQADLTQKTGKAGLIDIWRRELENAIEYHKDSKKTSREYYEIYENQEKRNMRSTDYSIFWANTQTLRPLLFSKLPKSNITQANYNDSNVARIASELVERVINYFLKESNAENEFEKTRDSYLIKGIGIPRVVFIPSEPIEKIEKIKVKVKKEKPKKEDDDEKDNEDEMTNDKEEDSAEGENDDYEEIEQEEKSYYVDDSKKNIEIEFVDYDNFLKSTEKEWKKLRWVAFKKYYSRNELIETFGEAGKKAPLTSNKYEMLKESEDELYKLCEVWEIWDKENRMVHFITTGGDGFVLDTIEDPYNLKNFFPIPQCMGLNDSLCSLMPIPLYRHYKGLAEDLEKIHNRISALVDQLRFTGLYTSLAEQKDVENLMNGDDGEFSAIQTTANIDDARKLVLFKPIVEIANTIASLRIEKQQKKIDIQEITGISDIVRGQTIASETATAQQLKGNFAISRIQPLQKEVEYTIRDTIRILAELAVEKFSINELMLITGLQLFDVETISEATKIKIEDMKNEAIQLLDINDPQKNEKIQQLTMQAQMGYEKTMSDIQEKLKGFAIELKDVGELEKMLKNDKLRCINIDIETDSTVRIDQNQEKQERIAYITTISNMVNAMAPVVQSGVISKEALNEFIKFASKPFKVGRNLENYLDGGKDQSEPTASEMIAQAEMQLREKELALKEQEIIGNLQIEQQKVDVQKANLLNRQNEFEQKLEFEDVNKQADRESKRLDMKVKAGTELINDRIRNANQPTFI